MWRQMIPALRMTLVLTVLTGVLYPGVVTAISQAVFPKQAISPGLNTAAIDCAN